MNPFAVILAWVGGAGLGLALAGFSSQSEPISESFSGMAFGIGLSLLVFAYVELLKFAAKD